MSDREAPKSLPTVADLETLSLRAVSAYAVRAARRLAPLLNGVVDSAVIEHAFRLQEAVATAPALAEVDDGAIIGAAQHVAAAYAAAPSDLHSLPRFRAVFAVANTAITAMWAAIGARDNSKARQCLNRAARSAWRVTKALESLDSAAADSANIAAWRDFEAMRIPGAKLGDVAIGEAIRDKK